MEIEILEDSILNTEVDAIVNAANSLGYMGGGVAGVIKRAAGNEPDLLIDENKRFSFLKVTNIKLKGPL